MEEHTFGEGGCSPWVGVCKNKLGSNCMSKGYIGGGIGTLRKIIVE